MLRPSRVKSVTRFHIREANLALLSPFDVVVIIDGADSYSVSKTPGSFSAAELDAFKHYYYTGHGLVLLCAGLSATSGAYQTAVLDLLAALSVGVSVAGDTFRPSGGTIRRKSGSVMKVFTAGEPISYTVDANLAMSAAFYTTRAHTRALFGEAGGREARFSGLSSPFTVDDTTVVATPSVVGTWTYLIVYAGMGIPGGGGDNSEDVRHLVFEPNDNQPSASAALEGRRPGRIVLDGGMKNFQTKSGASFGHPVSDQLRMLAEALIWANRGIVPEDVLVYNTAGRPSVNKGQSLLSTRGGDFEGLGVELSELLSLPLDQLGDGT